MFSLIEYRVCRMGNLNHDTSSHDINLFYYWDKLATMQHVCISFIIKNYVVCRIVPSIKMIEKGSLYHIRTI